LFHDRPTCARSRSRCSRPERGQPKVPFSACRCHILVVDYRWGSLGSDEAATATTGGPRVIDVFAGNGAPSGPNCLLFSDVDRPSDSLWDRSEVGWSPRPHAAALDALQRALDRKLWGIMVQSNRAQRTLLICMYRWERPRMRCRRQPMSSSDPRRPRGDLRTTNRQDSIDAPALVASSISRIKKINFFGPQEVSHRSLWTISELNCTKTAACRARVCVC